MQSQGYNILMIVDNPSGVPEANDSNILLHNLSNILKFKHLFSLIKVLPLLREVAILKTL